MLCARHFLVKKLNRAAALKKFTCNGRRQKINKQTMWELGDLTPGQFENCMYF